MTAGIVPLAIVGVVGLLLGLWLGLPGRDRPTIEDIEAAMDKGGGTTRRRRNKRSINPMAWVQRKAQEKPSRGRGTGGRKGFRLESPDERE
jgi:hypothetical protein